MVLPESLLNELKNLVCLPAACSRSYQRVSDTWRGNLLVQGIKNLADAVSHKVMIALLLLRQSFTNTH